MPLNTPGEAGHVAQLVSRAWQKKTRHEGTNKACMLCTRFLLSFMLAQLRPRHSLCNNLHATS